MVNFSWFCDTFLNRIDPVNLRYILARHGIDTQYVAGSTVPIRIGDVLILPVHSFRADASEGPQDDQACVWHGFLGSWKGVEDG